MLELLFNKVALADLQYRCFPKNIAKFLRKPILKNTCDRLLLIIAIWPIFSRKFAILVEESTVLNRVNLLF